MPTFILAILCITLIGSSGQSVAVLQDAIYQIQGIDGSPAGTIIIHNGSILQSYYLHALTAPQNITLDASDAFNTAINKAVGKHLLKFRETLAPVPPGQARVSTADNLIASQCIFYVFDAVAPAGRINNQPNPDREAELRSAYASLIALASQINSHFAGVPALSIQFPETSDQQIAWRKNLRAIIDLQDSASMQVSLQKLFDALQNPAEPPLSLALAHIPQRGPLLPQITVLSHLLQNSLSDLNELELLPINSIGVPVLGGGNSNYQIEESAPIAVPVLIEALQKYAVSLAQAQREFPTNEALNYLTPLTMVIYLHGGWDPVPARAFPVLMKELNKSPYATRLMSEPTSLA